MCRHPYGHRSYSLVPRGAAVFAIAASATVASPARAQPPSAGGVTAPVVVQHVDAVYPPSALPARQHADVVLTVTVDADGHVSKVDVAQSGGARPGRSGHRRRPPVDVRAGPARREARRQPDSHAVPLRTSRAAARAGRDGPGSRPASLAARRAGRARGDRRRPAPSSQRRPPSRPPRLQTKRLRPPTFRCDGQLEARTHGVVRLQGHARRAEGRPAHERVRRAQARAGLSAHERGRLGPRRAGVPARLRRARGAGPRVHRRRRPHQRRGQLPRQRLRRHALHHPRAHPLGARARGPVRAAAGRLRRRRQRRLPPRARPPRAHDRVHVRQLRHAALAPPLGPERRARPAPSPAPSTTRPTASGRTARPSAAPPSGSTRSPSAQSGVLRLNATAYATEYNTAGVVREDDYDSGRVGFYGTEDPNQVGNTVDARVASRRPTRTASRTSTSRSSSSSSTGRCACSRTGRAS